MVLYCLDSSSIIAAWDERYPMNIWVVSDLHINHYPWVPSRITLSLKGEVPWPGERWRRIWTSGPQLNWKRSRKQMGGNLPSS